MKKKSAAVAAAVAAIVLPLHGALADAVEKYKSFGDVITYVTDAAAENIQYGIICYPSVGVNRAAVLEPNDVRRLVDAYTDEQGRCIIAPLGDRFDALTEEAAENYPYFYMGISEPINGYEDAKETKMLRLCFGGVFGGATIYGGWGKSESAYEGAAGFNALPESFIWYKPVNGDNITALADELYAKYISSAKPFADEDESKIFDGYDLTWQTMVNLKCAEPDGCSDWARAILQTAMRNNLIPYGINGKYTQPVTRIEFCRLAANMLNMIPAREYDDFFKNPDGYTVLSKRATEKGAPYSDAAYTDMTETPECIKLLTALGIVSGTGDDKFDPDGYITREQLCTIMSRIFNEYSELEQKHSELSGQNEAAVFADDNKISDWARDSVYLMRKYGIVNGMGDNTFAPQDTCTLEQATIVIFKSF